MAGGAANVACNLAQLGLHVHLIGVCGNDKAAKDLETELASTRRSSLIRYGSRQANQPKNTLPGGGSKF